MSDTTTVLLAVAAWVGAAFPGGVPLPLGLALTAGALAARRPMLLVLAAGLLASGLAAMAWDRLDAPLPTRVVTVAGVVGDPRPIPGGSRLVFQTPQGRLEAAVRGPLGVRLGRLQAGTQVRVSGRVSEWSGSRSRQAAGHLRGRLAIEDAEVVGPGAWYWVVVNHFRSRVESGAEILGARRQALYTGLVYGDDRAQAAETKADFRAAGLSHLLAVSGQNIAFVLVVARPVIGRLGYRARFVAVLGVLFLFGAATRFEPSVLRASAMAATAATADLMGRDARPLRLLALGVAGLVLFDPLLIHSLAFQLSVAASAGIAVMAGPLRDRLPGPMILREGMAVTVAAQLAVAPLLVTTFGPVPLISVPANVVGAPAAGPVMVWGLTGGFVAGVLGGRAAAFLMVPVEPFLWWLERVAERSAALSSVRLGLVAVMGLALGVAIAVWSRSRVLRLSAGAATLGSIVIVVTMPVAATPGPDDVARAVTLWQGSGVTVVRLGDGAVAADGLDGLRGRGIGRIDLLVVTTSSARAAPVVGVLRRRLSVGEVVAPAAARIPHSTWPAPPARVRAPPWTVCLGPPGEVAVVTSDGAADAGCSR